MLILSVQQSPIAPTAASMASSEIELDTFFLDNARGEALPDVGLLLLAAGGSGRLWDDVLEDRRLGGDGEGTPLGCFCAGAAGTCESGDI